jgi:CHASE1-domain containing sensor protein/two-component sensor histidine kinase
MIALRRALFPVLAFLVAVLVGCFMTWLVWSAETRRAEADFERTADLAVDRVVNRIENHVVLLKSTRGLFAALRSAVDRDIFGHFLNTVDLVQGLSGIQGIGFARMVATEDSDRAASEVSTLYGLDTEIRPATQQPWRTVIVLIEPPSERNLAALGFDMYADDTRRAAMDRAMLSGDPQMSGPVELVQEITDDKQMGFLIYLAYGKGSSPPTSGFIYAPFRGSDLVRAALAAGPPLPVAMAIHDVGAPDKLIYADAEATSGAGLSLQRSVELVGRQWSFLVREISDTPAYRRHLGSLLVGLISILFGVTAALAISARQHEAEKAQEVAAAAARESEYRGLLLQEMKHRIKNHIARIQSIARQSARGATDVKAFTDTFDARLQAMAAVQEVLAGTAVPQADVRTLLRKELQQCLDTEAVEHLMDGPPVRLDERQAHAFAMVAHELVTNALKYGGLSATGQGLKITWSTLPGQNGDPPTLFIDWEERFDAPDAGSAAGTGFGSRLIEASLRGELSGSLTRDFNAQGLRIALSFPLNPAMVEIAAKSAARSGATSGRKSAAKPPAKPRDRKPGKG